MASEDYTRDSARTYGRTWPRTVAEPSLFLNFTSATALDPRITFSRGSQATLFDSTGTLRYAKHNLLLQSQTFQTTWATSQASVSADATTAPDGTTTADALVENTAANFHFVSQTVSGTTNTNNYTMSCFIKASTRTAARIAIIEGTTFSRQVRATVDLSNGTVVGAALNSATLTAATVQPVGNNWYRVTVTGVLGGTDTNIFCAVYVGQDPSTFNYTGNGTGSVFIWGAQLNLANMEGGVTSSLTTYYPTTTAAYYAPRFDYNPSTLQPRGLLIEEQRTNSIRNNTMQGAAAGTPGTLPTNWARFLAAELSYAVIGTGLEGGITYIDVRVSGTVSASRVFAVYLETPTGIAATNGQTYTASSYIKIASGSSANISTILFGADMQDSGGAYLGSLLGSGLTITSSALSGQRYSSALTTTNASTAFIRPYIRVDTAASGAVDITLRIGLPQLELGAFATSVIPTTTTALTRNADVASMTGTNFSSWYNQSEGTIVAQYIDPQSGIGGSFFPATFAVSDNTQNNRMVFYRDAAVDYKVAVTNTGSAQANIKTSTLSVTQRRSAFAYKLNDFAATGEGAAVVTDTSGTVPTVDRAYIGAGATGSGQLNGTIQRIAYYPVRLASSQLQALTA